MLAAEEHLAALVEVVAHGDDLLEREPRRAGARHLARLAGQVVVAGEPDDRVVVPEHGERVRSLAAHRVDVVGVVCDVVRGERGLVVVDVVRRAVGVCRRRTGVVLRCQQQHAVARVAVHRVGERRRLLARRLEPHLDGVAVGRARDRAAHAVVGDAGLLVVALAVAPFRRRLGRLGDAVDLVVQRHRAELALGEHLHDLRVAVGDDERVEVEVLDRVAEVRLRVRRVVGRLREVERERQVVAELPVDPALDVLVLEAGDRLVRRHGPLGRVGEDVLAVVRGVQRVAVGDVELGAEVRVEAGDGRVLVVTGERGEDRVVGGRRVLLPALRIQDQLGRRVVVLLEREVDLVPEADHRLRSPARTPRKVRDRSPTRSPATSPRRPGPSPSGSCGSGRRRRCS